MFGATIFPPEDHDLPTVGPRPLSEKKQSRYLSHGAPDTLGDSLLQPALMEVRLSAQPTRSAVREAKPQAQSGIVHEPGVRRQSHRLRRPGGQGAAFDRE